MLATLAVVCGKVIGALVPPPPPQAAICHARAATPTSLSADCPERTSAIG
jgi:hypothetical protein